ncbi:MAG: hypothetical protein ACC652_01505 [Acidimicrobiales bacterium]
MQARGISYAAIAVAGILLLSACSGGEAEADEGEGLCEVTTEFAGALVLSDDLLSRSASSGVLQRRMTEASRMLADLAETIEDEALRADALLVGAAVDEAVLALESAGYEPYLLVATGNSPDQEALTKLGSDEVTDARVRLVDEINASCDVVLDEPTPALGVVAESLVLQGPVRRTEVIVGDLSLVELTALISSGLGLEFESELLAIAGYRNISELLSALRSGEYELSRRAAAVVSSALQRGEYGDDESLDRLWDACRGSDYSACDLLWYTAPRNTAYELFGATCGERVIGTAFQNRCADELN